jgi:hypothetical protein
MRGFARFVVAGEVDVTSAPVVGGPQRYSGLWHGPSISGVITPRCVLGIPGRKRIRAHTFPLDWDGHRGGQLRGVTDVTVEWGHGRQTVVSAVDELDRVLDEVDREGRASRMPQDVQLTRSSGEGSLGIVVGSDRSLLNHVPASGGPPYRSSLGDEREDRVFTFWVAGDHHSESAWQHTIPAAQARAAARHFLLTGQLDARVGWIEV